VVAKPPVRTALTVATKDEPQALLLNFKFEIGFYRWPILRGIPPDASRKGKKVSSLPE
jgi:hypothetical protein